MTPPTRRRTWLAAVACASAALLAPSAAVASDYTLPGLDALELLGGGDWENEVIDPDAIADAIEAELDGLGLGEDLEEEYSGAPAIPPGPTGAR